MDEDRYQYLRTLKRRLARRGKLKTYPTKAEAIASEAQIVLAPGLARAEEAGGLHHTSSRRPWVNMIFLESSYPEETQEFMLAHELEHEKQYHTGGHPYPPNVSYTDESIGTALVELPTIIRARQRIGKWVSHEADYFRQKLKHLPTTDHRLMVVRSVLESTGYRGKVPWVQERHESGYDEGFLPAGTIMDDEKYERWLMEPKRGRVTRNVLVSRATGPGHYTREHHYKPGDPAAPLFHPRYHEEAVLSGGAGAKYRYDKGEISQEDFREAKEAMEDRLREAGDLRDRLAYQQREMEMRDLLNAAEQDKYKLK